MGKQLVMKNRGFGLVVAGILFVSSSCHGQTLTTTQTVLHVGILGSPGAATLDMLANVSTQAGSVQQGLVTFRVNGVVAGTAQVIGQSATHPTGSAELRLVVAAGSYKITASFGGTTALEQSASDSVTVKSPILAHAFLHAAIDATKKNMDFGLSSLDAIFDLNASILLKDAVSGSVVASEPVSASVTKLSSVITDMAFAFAPSSFLATDLTGRGTKDLLVGNSTTKCVEIFWQQTDGSYKHGAPLQVGGLPAAILAADFNGDGLMDIAVLDQTESSLIIFTHRSDGSDSFLPTGLSLATGHSAQSMAIADFNHDGYPDIAVANFADDTISVFLNKPDKPGTFISGTPLATGGGPSSIVVGDFLGKGMLDLAVTNYYDGTLNIFANIIGPNLFVPLPTVNPTGAGPISIAVCDLNGDGITDLAIANSLDNTVSVLLAAKDKPGEYPTQWIEADLQQPTSVSCQSSLGASTPSNLLVSTGRDGGVSLLRNDGTGRFPKRKFYSIGSVSQSAITLRAFDDKVFSLAILDPSLKMLHIVDSAWSSIGSLGKISLNQGGEHAILSIALDPESLPLVKSDLIYIDGTDHKTQVITFPKLSPVTYGVLPIQLAATVDSGLSVSYRLSCGDALLDGNRLTITNVGWVCVTAEQSGNDSFFSAPPVEQKIYVYKHSLLLTPNAGQRLFHAHNPNFTGALSGLVNGDQISALFSSGADFQTPPGIYSSPVQGITGKVLWSPASSKYSVETLIADLTVCPTAEVPAGIVSMISSCPAVVIKTPLPVISSPPGSTEGVQISSNNPIYSSPPTVISNPSNPSPIAVATPSKPVITPLSGHPVIPISSPDLPTPPGSTNTTLTNTLPVRVPPTIQAGSGLVQPVSGTQIPTGDHPGGPPKDSPKFTGLGTDAPKPIKTTGSKNKTLAHGHSPNPQTPPTNAKPKVGEKHTVTTAVPIINVKPTTIVKVQQGSSTTQVRIIPIPIPIPLPIPHLFKHKTQVPSAIYRNVHASLAIIDEANQSSVPGLINIVVIYECFPENSSSQNALIEVDGRLIGHVSLKSSMPITLTLPAGKSDQTKVHLRTLGSAACPSTSSNVAMKLNLPHPSIELEQSRSTSLIPELDSEDVPLPLSPCLEEESDYGLLSWIPIDPALPDPDGFNLGFSQKLLCLCGYSLSN